MKPQAHSAEDNLLLSCVANPLTRTSYSIPQDLDWEYILWMARAHKIEGLLYPYLQGANGQVSPQIRQRLARIYHRIGFDNLRRYEVLKKVLSAFNKARAEVVVLKGAVLAERVYENRALRIMNDFDLLVKKEDLSQIEEFLSKLGFIHDKPANISHKWFVSFHNVMLFINNDEKIRLDIHWQFTQATYPFQINEERMWNRAQPTEIAGVQALVLSSEDLLLHLCFHSAFKHFFSLGLKALADVAAVIHKYQKTLNWEEVVNYAVEYKIAPCVFATLYLVHKALNVGIPPMVLSRLKGYCAKNLLLWLEGQQTYLIVHAPSLETLVRLHLISEAKDKLKYLKTLFFFPRAELAVRDSFDPNSYWTYLAHLLKLEKKSFKNIFSKLTA